jgi:hypothetical protein
MEYVYIFSRDYHYQKDAFVDVHQKHLPTMIYLGELKEFNFKSKFINNGEYYKVYKTKYLSSNLSKKNKEIILMLKNIELAYRKYVKKNYTNFIDFVKYADSIITIMYPQHKLILKALKKFLRKIVKYIIYKQT